MIEEKLSSRFLKGIVSTGVGTLATIVFSLIGIMIAVRYVSKEELGTYILVLTIVGSIDLIADLGTNISTIKNLACCNHDKRKHIVSTIFLYKLAVASLICVLIFTTYKILNMFSFKFDYQEFIYYSMVLLVLESLNTLFNAILQGYQKFKNMAFAKIILSGANCLFIVALICYYHLGVVGLLFTRMISLFLVLIYQLIILRTEIRFEFNREVIRKILGFGLPLGLNNILSFIFLRLDTLMIGYFLNPMSVALYGIATKIPDAARQMFDAFRSVFFPNMSELFSLKKLNDAEAIMNNSLRIISFITVFIALNIHLFQNFIVKTLFSVNYIESAPVLSLLMLVLSIGLIGNIIGTSLVAAGHSRLPFIINIVDTVTTLTANLLLIPRYGVMGSAYAALISRVITNPVNVFFLKRNKIRVDVYCYIKPICVYLFCICVNKLFNNNHIAISILVSCLYIALNYLLKVIRHEDYVQLMYGLNKQPAKGLV